MKDLTPTPENPIDLARLERLRNLVGSGPVMILTHDSPDPDALAAGKALATLLNVSWSVPSRLFYSGLVARAENRAMLRLLTPEWESVEVAPDAQGFSAIALVDTQPGGGITLWQTTTARRLSSTTTATCAGGAGGSLTATCAPRLAPPPACSTSTSRQPGSSRTRPWRQPCSMAFRPIRAAWRAAPPL